LKAESQLLPFFLPFNSNSKKIVECALPIAENQVPSKTENSGKVSSVTPPPAVQASDSEETRIAKHPARLTDPRRKELITHHRVSAASKQQQTPQGSVNYAVTTRPSKQQKSPSSLANLQPIFLDDMDSMQDKVYHGKVLTGTLIEQCELWTAIICVMEDDRGQVERIAIYNHPSGTSTQSMKSFFRVGTRFSLLNPYHRLANDGRPMIRVDDSNSIIVSATDYKDICYYCGKPDNEVPLMKCARCQVACYCSKQCQQLDWKLFLHKEICKATGKLP
jgi:hypothetical protein